MTLLVRSSSLSFSLPLHTHEEPKNICPTFVVRFSHTFRTIGNVLKEYTPFILFALEHTLSLGWLELVDTNQTQWETLEQKKALAEWSRLKERDEKGKKNEKANTKVYVLYNDHYQ